MLQPYQINDAIAEAASRIEPDLSQKEIYSMVDYFGFILVLDSRGVDVDALPDDLTLEELRLMCTRPS